MQKFIEIEGTKYQVDPEDNTKPLVDENGDKVLYKEEPEPPTEPPKDDDPVDPPKDDKGSDPEKLKLQEEVKRLNAQNEERERKAEQEKREALEKQGQFEQLYKDGQAELEKVRGELTKERELNDKNKELLKEVLDEMIAQIAPDKQTLIPEGSLRQRIKYIKSNHKHLGVNLFKKGEKIPDNDQPPTDEQKKIADKKRFQELQDKARGGEKLSFAEDDEMARLGKLIKTY